MKIQFNKIGFLLKKAFKQWNERKPFRESAVIAYNAIFSLPGLLVVVISLAGYFFGADAVSGHLHVQISQMMGKDTADAVSEMVTIAMKSKNSILATIIGTITILIGATAVFVQMQMILNEIWEVKATTKKSGVFSFLRTRFFSFGLIISIAFLLLISLLLSSFLSGLGEWVRRNWSDSLEIMFYILDVLVSIIVVTVLFALMFKILPDVKIKWGAVWVGALITALLFVIGKFGLGLYFGKAEPGSGYGAAGSVILILLWTSYSSMIVFFGAEFTKVYSDEYFPEPPPDEHAVKTE